MPGKTISMFLLDGGADGRVACELFNWTGKAYKIPRHLLRSSAERKDLYRAGVYFLFGRDETMNEIAIAYVGEAEEIYPRLQQHQEKEFGNEALVFVSKDENLNKAHIKFLNTLSTKRPLLRGAIDSRTVTHRIGQPFPKPRCRLCPNSSTNCVF